MIIENERAYQKELKLNGIKRCSDCRDGEHDNYDNDVCLVTVKNPEDNRIMKRANLCENHRSIYLDDGYKLFKC